MTTDDDLGLDANLTFRLMSSEKEGAQWLASKRSAANLRQGGSRVTTGALVREALVRMLRAEGWPEAMQHDVAKATSKRRGT